MFLFGFLIGIGVAVAFVLYGNGELLINLGEQLRKSSERFWAWQRNHNEQK